MYMCVCVCVCVYVYIITRVIYNRYYVATPCNYYNTGMKALCDIILYIYIFFLI